MTPLLKHFCLRCISSAAQDKSRRNASRPSTMEARCENCVPSPVRGRHGKVKRVTKYSDRRKGGIHLVLFLRFAQFSFARKDFAPWKKKKKEEEEGELHWNFEFLQLGLHKSKK